MIIHLCLLCVFVQGSALRQEYLQSGKYFRCHCKRCCDPTELGTHLSSVKCQLCLNGLMIAIVDNPSEWCCQSCDGRIDATHIQRLLRDARSTADHTNYNIDDVETFIQNYETKLNPNHYIIIEMKQKLAALIRQAFESNPKHSNGRSLHHRKIEICQELYVLLNVLQPGLSRLRGIALYEQFISFHKLAKMIEDTGDLKSFELFVSHRFH